MKYAKIQTQPNQIQFRVTVHGEELHVAQIKASQKFSSSHPIKGFRPGKAPIGVVKSHVGAKTFIEETCEIAIKDSFSKILSENQWEIMGNPKFSTPELREGEQFEYQAEIAIRPSVKLGDCHALTSKRGDIPPVTDEDVSAQLKKLQNLKRQRRLVKRPAQKGDEVEIDFTVSSNRIPIENGSQKNVSYELGAGQILPDIEALIIGMASGQEKTSVIVFPPDYYNKDIAGSQRDVHVVMRNVFEVIKPNLDDAFARSMGKDFSSLMSLSNHIRNFLRSEKEQHSMIEWDQALIDELVERSEIGDLPDLLIQSEIDKMMTEFRRRSEWVGLKFEDYLVHLKKTENEFRQTQIEPAKKRLRASLVLTRVAEEKRLTITNDEMEDAIKEHKKNPDGKYMDPHEMAPHVASKLLHQKIMNALRKPQTAQ